MLRKHPLAGLAILAVALSACADTEIVEPAAPDADRSALLSDATLTAEAPGRHLVVLKGMNAARLEKVVSRLGGEVLFAHEPTGIAGVAGLDEAGVKALGSTRGIALVEAEPAIPMAEPVSISEPELAAVLESPSDPTSSTFYPRQWHLRAIYADQAWTAGRSGSSDVTVAILDSGIGYTHYDLEGRVDLSRSASFVEQDDAIVALAFPGAHPIADIGYHGTHVAATVASNGWVAAGVTSEVTLIGAKVCSVVLGYCPGLAIFQGIIHAVENGADVANMSLGGWFTKRGYPGYVSSLATLFNYAKQNDVTFVVSAGNDAIDLDRQDNVPIEDEEGNEELYHIPTLFKTYCEATHAVCVSATGPDSAVSVNGPWFGVDSPAPYTNYGRSAIDVAAPGGSFGGVVWAACSTFSLVIPPCQGNGYVLGIGGTSMASPHVAGLAALAVEDVGKNVAKVRRYITGSADPIGGGSTPFYGRGRINVARAVGAM
jgi:subtilisin family serine protease